MHGFHRELIVQSVLGRAAFSGSIVRKKKKIIIVIIIVVVTIVISIVIIIVVVIIIILSRLGLKAQLWKKQSKGSYLRMEGLSQGRRSWFRVYRV